MCVVTVGKEKFPVGLNRSGFVARGRSQESLKSHRLPLTRVDEDRTIEEILDTIGDEHAREILAAVSAEARPAKEVAKEVDLSLPTVYRRIELLEEHALIRSRTLVAEDGNHYQVYESNFDSTVIRLEDDEYNVRIYRKENLPDRFSNLWDDLSGD